MQVEIVWIEIEKYINEKGHAFYIIEYKPEIKGILEHLFNYRSIIIYYNRFLLNIMITITIIIDVGNNTIEKYTYERFS